MYVPYRFGVGQKSGGTSAWLWIIAALAASFKYMDAMPLQSALTRHQLVD